MQTPSPYTDLRVLLVDDHMLMRTTIGHILHSLGFREIETASNGEEAWEALARRHEEGKPFHIAFIDWQMPVMDGLALLQKVRADKRFDHTAFVMLTAERDERKIVQTLEKGVTSYLIKPVSPGTMEKNLNYVMRWLEQRQAPRATLPSQLCQDLKPVMAQGMEQIFSDIFNVDILTEAEMNDDRRTYDLTCIGHLYRDDIDLTLRFLFDKALLLPLLAQFYAPEFLSQREVYEDAACEIVNILCNQVKAYLGRQGYHMVLNLPRVVQAQPENVVDSVINIHFSLNDDRHFMVDLADSAPG